ncbi:hypothetical protein CJF30_00001740 [Rutstroemia sp. NJR-2017a BBW]|nr:hypothetical protein CJF30_00001740 [Rutstroemia sp. NJR-2017a BBW]
MSTSKSSMTSSFMLTRPSCKSTAHSSGLLWTHQISKLP